MDAGVSQDKIAGLQAKATRMRGQATDAMAGLQGRHYGGVYTANNPLEFLAAGVKSYKSGKAADAADQQISDDQDSISKARGMYFNTGMMGRDLDPRSRTAVGNSLSSGAKDSLNNTSIDLEGSPSANFAAPSLGPQMAQAAALRRKKNAATPGQNLYEPDEDGKFPGWGRYPGSDPEEGR